MDSKGNIFYIGRRDSLVKRFGNKVNLAELEKLMLSSDLVKKCAAIWNDDEQTLHLCVVSNTDNVQVSQDMREFLNTIPKELKPDEIHCMHDFPLTEHGKVCKSSLAGICTRRSRPKDNAQATFQDLWKEHLGTLENLGFFQLGGDSILALQFSNAVSAIFQIEAVHLLTLFLQNTNLEDCLSWVLKEIGRKKNVGTAGESKEEMEMEKVSKSARCSWQKCRGKMYEPLLRSKFKTLEVMETYDLEKCIDGSPNIFYCKG